MCYIQYIYIIYICVCLGLICFGLAMAYIPFIVLKARKFSLLFSLGSLFTVFRLAPPGLRFYICSIYVHWLKDNFCSKVSPDGQCSGLRRLPSQVVSGPGHRRAATGRLRLQTQKFVILNSGNINFFFFFFHISLIGY